MIALLRHGPGLARGAVQLSLRTAFGPDFAEIALAQGAMFLVLAQAQVYCSPGIIAA